MTEQTQADRRLRHLYEISTHLTRFEGVGRTLADVVAVAARALPVRTAVLILEGRDGISTHLWKTEDVDAPRAAEAIDRARAAYGWFRGSPPPRDRDGQAPSVRGLAAPTDDVAASSVAYDPRYLALPLVVERGRVFGVLQLEGAGGLDEDDLFFVNAAANQIAVAIDRQRATDDAEARARTQLAFTRALTDSVGEGIMATDTDGLITFLNPAAEELLGWSESDVLGRPSFAILHVQTGEGAGLGSADCPLARALATGKRAVCDDHAFLARDGVAFPVSYIAGPIRAEGRVSGACVVFRDVLALKRSERDQRFLASASAALANSLHHRDTLAALVRCAVPSFADICFVEDIDADTRRPTARARALTSAGAVLVEDVSEETIADLTDDPGHAALLRASGARSILVVALSVRGHAFGVLVLAMAASGRRYTSEDIWLADELAHRAAAVLDNARLHRALEGAVQDRQDILEVVSHDLRSPLNTVSMAAASLLEGDPELDRRRADRNTIEMIARAAQRMTRMTHDLLDVASIEAGRLAVDARSTAVAQILAEATEAMAEPAKAGALELVARPIAPDLLVQCDRDRIHQVMANLVGNAIKFTPPGGSIALSAEPEGAFVRFAVADSGPGIAEHLRAHVFERYRQAAETASQGRGLGLFITKGIVEAHGGTIDVDTAVGRGTTIVFRLPREPTVGDPE